MRKLHIVTLKDKDMNLKLIYVYNSKVFNRIISGSGVISYKKFTKQE